MGAEREQIARLRRRIPRSSVVTLGPRTVECVMPTFTERSPIDDGRRPLGAGVLVLVSPLRDTETIESVQKLR